MFFLVGCVSISMEDQQQEYVIKTKYTKGKAFNKSLDWLAVTFKSSKAVIERKDRKNGRIIGNGIVKWRKMGLTHQATSFSLIIDLKNYKARLSFVNIKYRNGLKNLDGTPAEYESINYQHELDEVMPHLEKLIDDYEAYMKGNTYKNLKSDW